MLSKVFKKFLVISLKEDLKLRNLKKVKDVIKQINEVNQYSTMNLSSIAYSS